MKNDDISKKIEQHAFLGTECHFEHGAMWQGDTDAQMLFKRFERAALNQTNSEPKAQFSRYNIWAEDLKSCIAEAVSAIEAGESQRAKDLLGLVHNGLSAFCSVQAILDNESGMKFAEHKTKTPARINGDTVILGVDAAWTAKEPSGTALIETAGEKYRIIKVGRSYQEFINGYEDRPKGSVPDFQTLLAACNRQGYFVDAIALDIPLANGPIMGRRACDNAISSNYGGRGASTHSPSAERPGPISQDIHTQLTGLGYTLALKPGQQGPVFLEVYPHTVILELFKLKYRMPYKVSKRGRYWPELSAPEKIREAVLQLNRLLDYLRPWFTNIDEHIMPLDPSVSYTEWKLKGQEDLLDALLSGLAGAMYLQGKIVAYGDDTGVIWVPKV